MPSPRVARFCTRLAALAVALALGAHDARADWTGAGVPVCTAVGAPGTIRTVSDGAAGVFVAWTDARAGASNSNIYMQHLDANGALSAGWPANGLGVCTVAGRQQLGDMVANGQGGAILAWEDTRASTFPDIYAQLVNADGTMAWDVDGLALCTAFGSDQHGPRAVSDGAGGAFFAWPDSRTAAATHTDIFATHVTVDGQQPAGWDLDGNAVTVTLLDDNLPSLVPDGAGGLYVAWVHDLADPDIWVQHLDDHGRPATGWTSVGSPLGSGTGDQTGVKLVPGASGTALAVWRDTRSSLEYYALRFGPGPGPASGWPANGRQIYGNTNGKQAPFVAGDDAGGAFIAWGELVSSTNEDLFAMHIDSTGLTIVSIAHPDGVVPLCADTLYQDPTWLASDGAGGALFGWTDYRPASPGGGSPAAYVQHVTPGATLATGWPADGVAVASGAAPQSTALPAGDAAGGAFVAWILNPGGATADLYASHVGVDGVVPALVSLVRADADGSSARIEWRVAGSASESFDIERSADGTTWSWLARREPGPDGSLVFRDDGLPAASRWAYRLIAAGTGLEVAGSLAWIELPGGLALAIHAVVVEAMGSAATVRCALASDAPATLRLLDAQGRARAKAIVAGHGEHTVRLTGLGALAPGLYWLRLEQQGAEARARLTLIR